MAENEIKSINGRNVCDQTARDAVNNIAVVSTANGITIEDTAGNFEATNVEGALAELFQNVSNGKTLIASAITDKGIDTSSSDNFQTMANNISRIQAGVKDPYREGRILVWEDDFNESTLNTDSWNYETGYLRDNELQNYTNSTKNVYIENSNLVLKAIRESSVGYKKGVGMTTFDWSSGSINTNNKHEFQYGRLEAKMKIPQTIGSFPAFWTLGAGYEYVCSEDENRGNKGISWPYCGEIDIMEHKNGAYTVTAGSLYNTNINATSALNLGRVNSTELDFNKYHIYALEWTKDKLDIYVDDKLISSSDITDNNSFFMFKTPHFLILNLAVGAAGGDPPSNVNEYTVYVDWVRYYAPVEENALNVSISDTAKSISVNDSFYLKINFLDKFNYDRTIKWQSSDPAVATVYGGKVTGINNGTANITATTSNGDILTCVVTVGEGSAPVPVPVTGISINDASVKVGETITVSPTFTPTNTTQRNVTFSSSANDIASIDSNTGVVTGMSKGTAIITCTSVDNRNISGTCTITVTQTEQGSSSFSFNASDNIDIDSIFTTASNAPNYTIAYENGYLLVKDIPAIEGGQESVTRILPKDFVLPSGKIAITCNLAIESYRTVGSNLQDTEGIRFAVDLNGVGMYLSLTQQYGIRYYKGNEVSIPTALNQPITADEFFTLKIVIDFANHTNCEIYYNNNLIGSIPYSDWTSNQYVDKNNFFMFVRNAHAKIKTIEIEKLN